MISEKRTYRVLMIAPTSFFADYGCHVRILEEARILQKLGHRVTIVTYHNGGPVAGLDICRTLPIPWRADYEVGSSRHKIGFDVLLGLKTLELLTRERFDVIHAHLHEGALIGIGAIVLDGAEVGRRSIVGAGSLVPPGMKIPDQSLALGIPVKPTSP